MSNTKMCTKCTTLKTLDEFHNSKITPDGKAYYCKDCKKKCHKPRKDCILTKQDLETFKQCTKCLVFKKKKLFAKDKKKTCGVSSRCNSCRLRGKIKHKVILSKEDRRVKISCKRCEKDLPKENFYRSSGSRSGVRSTCKKCSLTRTKELEKEDPIKRFKKLYRKRTLGGFKYRGWKKGAQSGKLLKCTWEIAKDHIEKQFSEGMTWDNHGRGPEDWQLDHIIPLSSASTEEELRELCVYSNLQPLWRKDNLQKGSKLDWIPN